MRLVCLLTTTLFAINANANVSDDDSLFEMSLEQLLNIELKGKSSQVLHLNQNSRTGNPFELPIRELSYTVERIDSNVIQARSIENVIQAVENVTGVLMGQSPSEPYSFSTRGFTRNSINVLNDGISMGLSTLNMRPQTTLNLAAVEIIKGPSSLQSSESAAGATVNIIRKKAQAVPSHHQHVWLSAGEYGSSTANVSLLGPLSNQLAYRIDLGRSDSEGYVDRTNSFNQEMAVSLLWTPSATTDIWFSTVLASDELPGYWGTPFVPANVADNPISGVISHDSGLTLEKATRFNNYNVSDHHIKSTSAWQRIDWQTQLNNNWQFVGTVYGFTADREWQNAESYEYNPDLAMIERDRLLVEHDRDNWGLKGSVVHQLTHNDMTHKTNLILQQDTIDFARVVGFNLASPSLYWDSVDLYDPVAGDFGYVDHRRDSLNQVSSAFILLHRIELERTAFDLEYKVQSIEIDRQYINWNGTVRDRATIDTDFQINSYRLGFNHQWQPELNLYGTYSDTHDPIHNDIRAVYDLTHFNPSDVIHTELGFKYHNPSNELQIAGAVYRTTKELKTQPSSELIFKMNKQNNTGLELAVDSNYQRKWFYSVEYAYVDAVFDNYYEFELGIDANNNRPINVPQNMLSLRTSYLMQHWPVELGGNVQFVDKRWANAENSISLSDYTTVSLYAAYEYQNYRISANWRNATDQVYGPWSDLFYPNQLLLAPPATFSLTLQAKF